MQFRPAAGRLPIGGVAMHALLRNLAHLATILPFNEVNAWIHELSGNTANKWGELTSSSNYVYL